MNQFDRSDGIAALLAAVLMLAAGILGLTELAGAHPFWARQVVYLGVPVGLILAWLVRRIGMGRTGRLGLYILGTAAFFALASWGKMRFAASFAEDTLAGQFWYFGWIATAALGTALLARLFSRN